MFPETVRQQNALFSKNFLRGHVKIHLAEICTLTSALVIIFLTLGKYNPEGV